MTDSIFSPEHFELIRKPLHKAGPLPSWCYTDQDWFDHEVENIFRKDWLCVGRVEQIPNTGDYFTFNVIKQPLIVVRDENGDVRVHLGLCRHRGAIVAEGKGKCRSFICPYHSWTYSLSGKLVGIPGSPHPLIGVDDFDNADYGLLPVRSETWGGFIFVTFNEEAQPLTEWLDDLPAFLEEYNLDQMQWTHADVYDVECNWKVWLENAFENYHVATVHRDHYDPANPQNWQFERPNGPWEAMFSKRSVVAYSGLPQIPGVSDDRAAGLYHIWVKPSLQIIITASYMKYRQYLPQGPNHVRLIENWTFPKSTVDSPEFDNIVGPEYYHKYSQIIREDLVITPNVQQAMHAGSFRPGRYSLEEYVVHRIGNFVVDRVVGPDSPGSRALRDGTLTEAAE